MKHGVAVSISISILSLAGTAYLFLSSVRERSVPSGHPAHARVPDVLNKEALVPMMRQYLEIQGMRDPAMPLIVDRWLLWDKCRDEILKTLEIAEILEADEFALVLFRYSVAADVFRDSTWIRRIDDKWYVSPRYVSTYDDDPLGDDNPVRAKALAEKAEKWKKESAPKPWE